MDTHPAPFTFRIVVYATLVSLIIVLVSALGGPVISIMHALSMALSTLR
jgi:hypothetical protein